MLEEKRGKGEGEGELPVCRLVDFHDEQISVRWMGFEHPWLVCILVTQAFQVLCPAFIGQN